MNILTVHNIKADWQTLEFVVGRYMYPDLTQVTRPCFTRRHLWIHKMLSFKRDFTIQIHIILLDSKNVMHFGTYIIIKLFS